MSTGGGGGIEAIWQRRRLFGAAASVFLLIAALTLAIVGGDGREAAVVQEAARIVDAAEIEELEGTLGHPLYWAGRQAGQDLELRAEADGNVYLRYLPPGTAAGDPRQDFLTVGTYSVPDAEMALQATAEANGTKLQRREDGSVVLANPSSTGSAYLAYPDSDLEIEVYDPEPGRALTLVRSGAIEPVGE
jgi:hypothetical protein